MIPMEIAEARASQSDDPDLFMLAYSAGWSVADSGADVEAYARSLTCPEMDAGFIEGLAARRALTATPQQFLQSARERRLRADYAATATAGHVKPLAAYTNRTRGNR